MEGPARILIVDDEVGMREGCRRALVSHGYRAATAEHGVDGLRKLREEPFDLVLLDAMMPGMSGWEVCRNIRESDQLAGTKILMLTGIGARLNEMTSPLYGADDYLDKPFEFDAFERKVRGLLSDGDAE